MLRSIGKNILQYELGSKVSIDPYRQLTLVSRPSAYICFKNTNSWLKNHLNFFIQFCAHFNDEKRFLGKKTVEKHLHAYTFVLCQTSQKQGPNENTYRREICCILRNDLGKKTTNLWLVLVKTICLKKNHVFNQMSYFWTHDNIYNKLCV